MSLILGGVEIVLDAVGTLQQSYQPIGGSSLLRMQSGKGIKQTHWQKLSTTIQGDGWLPPGLMDLDYSQPLLLSCIAPRSVVGIGTALPLPAARRSDAGYTPQGLALVGRQWVATAVSMSGDTANLTPVSGASRYQALYYPELTVYADEPQEEMDVTGAAHRWSLTAEEE